MRKVLQQNMDDIVDLETSNCPLTQLPCDTECEVGGDIGDWSAPVSAPPSAGRGAGRWGEGDQRRYHPIRNQQPLIKPGVPIGQKLKCWC